MIKQKIIEFVGMTKDEYNKIKSEINNRFGFVSVKRNTQHYALGGFNLNPRDEGGLTEKQIDSLCIFLKSLGIDDAGLSVQSEEVYSEDKGDFAGTKKKHLILKDGFTFLMRLRKDE